MTLSEEIYQFWVLLSLFLLLLFLFLLLDTSYILELNEESKRYKQVYFHPFYQFFHILL